MTVNKQSTDKGSAPVHYVIWDLGPGGMELGILHYIDHFGPGRKLYVYGIKARENRVFDENRILVGKGGLQPGNAYLNYFKYCRKYRKAVFHLNNGGPVILLLTLLAGVVNPVYHIHGTIYWKTPVQKIYLKASWWAVRLLMIFRKVTFVANSGYSASVFQDKVFPADTRQVYNGFDTGRFIARRSRRKALRKMAYIGRLQTGKNVDMVVRLFEKAAADRPELELHIAGSGPLKEQIDRRCAESPYADRITCHGFVSDIDVFYGEMDLFVFLSAYESFGNVVAEALLTGLPVLTSNVPAFREIHGGDGAFDLGDPSDYPGVERRFLHALDHYPELADKAYELSAEMGARFSVASHLSQITAIYEKL
ncbi:MAG: glycosyltransferase family 4 protein [Lewinellaceae bacterium]|nr:glycosyltransferase family 4 protein [Lewinellaceae bacterium]